jgi:hypothetical protein
MLPFCKLWSVVSLGSHLVTVPVLLPVGPFAITPVTAVSAACFLRKHPGKPMAPEQIKQWDSLYKGYGLR